MDILDDLTGGSGGRLKVHGGKTTKGPDSVLYLAAHDLLTISDVLMIRLALPALKPRGGTEARLECTGSV